MTTYLTAGIIISAWLRRLRRKRDKKDRNAKGKKGELGDEDILPKTLQPALLSTLTFVTLQHATDNFSPRLLLGKGRHSCVYKATLSGGQEIAVKRILSQHALSLFTGGEWAQQVGDRLKRLCRIRHKNLVNVLRYCEAPFERLLVMEYVGGGSLEHHLHGDGAPLSWEQRARIAAQVAMALEFLHETSFPSVVHGNLKGSNILLDGDGNARVADFGIPLSLQPGAAAAAAEVSAGAAGGAATAVGGAKGRGSWGSPSPLSSGSNNSLAMDASCVPSSSWGTKASDVYSFGVMLLEMITGKRRDDASFGAGKDIVGWAMPLIKGRCAKQMVDGRLEASKRELRVVLLWAKIARRCVGSAKTTPITKVAMAMRKVQSHMQKAKKWGGGGN